MEQAAVGMAAGLALSGKIPYVYSIMPFVTSRPFEQVKLDCAYMNTNVRVVGVGGGFAYGPAGATHHSIDDLAIMRALPNMAVVAPGDLTETEELVRYSVKHQGPMFIRLNRRGEPRYDHKVEFGKFSTLCDGEDFAIISTSAMLKDAYEAVEEFHKEGKHPLLLSAHTIKPFDEQKVLELVQKNMPIITVEEHNIIGGLYSCVAEVVAKSGMGAKILPIAVHDKFSHFVGGQEYIKSHMGLSGIKQQIDNFLNRK
jgi:transketolase